MELLPIIYFSLVIFAVLTVVTIIISYVSYKIRQSKKTEEEGTDGSDQILTAKKFIGDKPTKYQTKISHGHSKKRTTKVYKQSHRKKHYRKDSHKKDEPTKPLRRIEVLNNLEPKNSTGFNQSQKEFNKPETMAKQEKLNSLGDNILDKYADDLKNGLYTLDSNKKNKRTKGN